MKRPAAAEVRVLKRRLKQLEARQAYIDRRAQELLKTVANVAAGDFSKRPRVVERQDPLSQFVIGFRFMIEDLAIARAEEERQRQALQKANEELRVANDRLKELDELKTQFINTAAHELGTPLTPLRLQLHLLRASPDLTTRQEDALNVLDRNVERLTALVGDVLDVVRMQASRFNVEREPMDLAKVVSETVESFAPQARHQGVRLEARVGGRLELMGDGRRLSQVMFNLISNALKFTPAGGTVEVVAGVENGQAVVRVRDTGAGMKPVDIDRLFKPFTQVHDPMQRTAAGSGLGLYICRGILEQHGGRIWCDSEGPGRGSLFAFALPLTTMAAVRTRVSPSL